MPSVGESHPTAPSSRPVGTGTQMEGKASWDGTTQQESIQERKTRALGTPQKAGRERAEVQAVLLPVKCESVLPDDLCKNSPFSISFPLNSLTEFFSFGLFYLYAFDFPFGLHSHCQGPSETHQVKKAAPPYELKLKPYVRFKDNLYFTIHWSTKKLT